MLDFILFFACSCIFSLTDKYSFSQPVIRLYSVPLNAFTGEEEEEAEAEETEEPDDAA